jgi:hypothetical protein
MATEGVESVQTWGFGESFFTDYFNSKEAKQ